MLNYDINVLNKMLSKMPLVEVREWAIKVIMAEQGKTFESIAKPRRISKWYLSKAVIGKAPWNPKIVNALEKGLNVDVTGFLTEDERERNGR